MDNLAPKETYGTGFTQSESGEEPPVSNRVNLFQRLPPEILTMIVSALISLVCQGVSLLSTVTDEASGTDGEESARGTRPRYNPMTLILVSKWFQQALTQDIIQQTTFIANCETSDSSDITSWRVYYPYSAWPGLCQRNQSLYCKTSFPPPSTGISAAWRMEHLPGVPSILRYWFSRPDGHRMRMLYGMEPMSEEMDAYTNLHLQTAPAWVGQYIKDLRVPFEAFVDMCLDGSRRQTLVNISTLRIQIPAKDAHESVSSPNEMFRRSAIEYSSCRRSLETWEAAFKRLLSFYPSIRKVKIERVHLLHRTGPHWSVCLDECQGCECKEAEHDSWRERRFWEIRNRDVWSRFQ